MTRYYNSQEVVFYDPAFKILSSVTSVTFLTGYATFRLVKIFKPTFLPFLTGIPVCHTPGCLVPFSKQV